MNENELKKLWQETNARLEKSLITNRINSEEIARLKVFHFISSMKLIKLFALITGIVWVGLGMVVLSHIYFNGFTQVNKFFLFSASFQVGLTGIALVIYLYQLITIYQVDITESLLKTQEKISNLKSSTLLVTRILILQLPVWTTFYWNSSMFENGNWFMWIIQGSVTLSFVFAAVWLFININYENRDKKWFRLIFNGKEWIPLLKSMELLKQIDEFSTENNQ